MSDADLNRLAEAALRGGAGERAALAAALGLDDLNVSYFLSLYRAKREGHKSESLRLYQPGASAAGRVAYSTASGSDGILKSLPIERHRDLPKPSGPGQAALWAKKMQAGTGSGMSRKSYLSRCLGIPEPEVRLGAKGTDLFVDLPGRGKHCLAELQIARLLLAARNKEFAGVVFQDLVGPETEKGLEASWNRPCLVDPARTYAMAVADTPWCRRFGKVFQSHLPTLDRGGRLTFRRKAPGGHALFAVDAIRACVVAGAIPDTGGRPLVAAIGNGEDLGSTPSRAMVEWMVRKRVAIAMVTTEKTGVDKQGGQLTVVDDQGERYVALFETAQAKEAGQLEYFQRLGLEPGDRPALFNTNLALFHYDILAPKIRKLHDEIGETKLMGLLNPDLIDKWKSQKDPDGSVREYLQLEGAMGSTLLNLDRYWRKRYGEPLVCFLHVDASERTDFFSPVKNGFDLFLQFHSDRFRVDPDTFRLVNLRPGHLPLVSLSPAGYWEEVSTTLDAFEGARVKGLDSLKVEGPVKLAGAELRGRVEITVEGTIERDLGKQTWENVRVAVAADGSATRSPLLRN